MKAYSLSLKVVQFTYKTMKNAQVTTFWMVTGTAKYQKVRYLMSHIWEAIQATGWNSFGTHMTTWDTHTLNFVQFWRGHVQNFSELIWNYPLKSLGCGGLQFPTINLILRREGYCWSVQHYTPQGWIWKIGCFTTHKSWCGISRRIQFVGF